VRVNELASERAGESEPAITTMYYALYVGVSKTETNGIRRDTVFSSRVSRRDIRL